MNFEIELKNLIRSQYGSINSFAKVLGLPYSTINNIFNRGIMGVSVQIALKICIALNIDIEQIANDKLVLKDTSYNNADAQPYLKLNATGKAKADEYIEDLADNPKYTQPLKNNDAEFAADKYSASNVSYARIAAKGQGTQRKLITDEQRQAAFKALYELDNNDKLK